MHERKDINPTSVNTVKGTEINVNCLRCKYIIKQRKKLLNKTIANIEGLFDICHRCRQKVLQDKEYKQEYENVCETSTNLIDYHKQQSERQDYHGNKEEVHHITDQQAQYRNSKMKTNIVKSNQMQDATKQKIQFQNYDQNEKLIFFKSDQMYHISKQQVLRPDDYKSKKAKKIISDEIYFDFKLQPPYQSIDKSKESTFLKSNNMHYNSKLQSPYQDIGANEEIKFSKSDETSHISKHPAQYQAYDPHGKEKLLKSMSSEEQQPRPHDYDRNIKTQFLKSEQMYHAAKDDKITSRTYSEPNLNVLFHNDPISHLEKIPLIDQMFGSGTQITETTKKRIKNRFNIKFGKKVQKIIGPQKQLDILKTDILLTDSLQTLDKSITDKEMTSETASFHPPSEELDKNLKTQTPSKYIPSTTRDVQMQDAYKSRQQKLDARDLYTEDYFIDNRESKMKKEIMKKRRIQSVENLEKIDLPIDSKQKKARTLRKHSSDTCLFQISLLSQDPSEFSYHFLKEYKDKKPLLQNQKSSSELIKETQDLLRVRAEKELAKKEQRKKKLEMETKKIACEDNNILKLDHEVEAKSKDEEEKSKDALTKYESDTSEKKEKLKISAKSSSISAKKSEPKPETKNNKELVKLGKGMDEKRKEETIVPEKDIKQKTMEEKAKFKKQNEDVKSTLNKEKENEKERLKKEKEDEKERLKKEKEEEKERLKKENELEKSSKQKDKELEAKFRQSKPKEDNIQLRQKDNTKQQKQKEEAIQTKQDHVTIDPRVKKTPDDDKEIKSKKEQENKEKEKREIYEKKLKEAAEKKTKEEAKLKLKSMQEDDKEQELVRDKVQKKGEKSNMKDLKMDQVKIRHQSPDDMILELLKLKQSQSNRGRPTPKRLSEINVPKPVIKAHTCHKTKNNTCLLCGHSDLDLDICNIESKQVKVEEIAEIIIGEKIVKYKPPLEEKLEEKKVVPILFQSVAPEIPIFVDKMPQFTHSKENEEQVEVKKNIHIVDPKKMIDQEISKGVTRYALSDRTFIDKGWTMLPTEKVVRKMNVYRMRPAHPEFNWFEQNKSKKVMSYDTGEKLAEFDENGRGRWYYRNGRLALDYYDAEETNTQQRIVIYSSGEPDERGRSRPLAILATFDYLGNGVVFDHAGKIRLKYNQTEGVVLDRTLGPVSHWKWHALNDPPVLQQVMIDTQMAHKDPTILKLGGPSDGKPRPDNEEMLAIEFDNFIKEKSKKLTQKFKPFQIKMKALKINEYFSLKVLDQATVYIIYRDGSTNLKLNIGMILDHQEIVDTDTAEVGEVSNSLERFPARTDSLAGLQKSVEYAQRVEGARMERERRLRPSQTCASADKLTAGISKPLQPPFLIVPSESSVYTCELRCKCNRKPSKNNIYYDTRII